MAVIILRTKKPLSSDPNRRASARDAALGDVEIEVVDLGARDLADLQRDPTVLDAAPSMPLQLIQPFAHRSTTTSPPPAVSWGIEAVHATRKRWTGEGVTVAVLDTGIDKSHAAFHGVDLFEKDFTGEGNGDANGHGTHCAGTIFGRDVGGARIGVARGVRRALIGKVLRKNGSGSSDQFVEAIQWAAKEGAQVVSLSLGIDFPGYVKKLVKKPSDVKQATSRALELYRATVRIFDALAALIHARGDGCVLVAAAGNESNRPKYRITATPPAEAGGFLSVAAVQPGDQPGTLEIAPFSNANAKVAAPGVGIWSARAGDKNSLCCMDGTSMAAPHVAGVAARWAQCLRAQTGRIKASEVVARLTGTAELSDLDAADVGMGIVQAPK